MSMDLKTEVMEKLKEVVDPEFGRPIMDRNLVDEIKIEGNRAKIIYHLTVPFCPLVFAIHIGEEIKKKAMEVEGIESVEVIVKEHNQADVINKELKKD